MHAPSKLPKLEMRRHGHTTRYLYDSCTIGTIEHDHGQCYLTTQQGYQGRIADITIAKRTMWEHSCFFADETQKG